MKHRVLVLNALASQQGMLTVCTLAFPHVVGDRVDFHKADPKTIRKIRPALVKSPSKSALKNVFLATIMFIVITFLLPSDPGG
jgi:hypothetical protein